MPATRQPPTQVGRLAHSWAGAADGPLTVVLHGGGPGCHSASDFAAIVARRPERRWLLVDLPGYGASAPIEDPARSRLGVAADALGALLDHLELPRVDVVGQSLGGSVALRLAAHIPERIRRLALIGSQPTTFDGVRTDSGLGARARATYYGDGGPSPAKMRALLALLEWYDGTAIPESTVLNRHAAGTTPIAQAAALVPAPAEDLGELLGAVTAPTFVLWGRHDPFAGPDYATALADALPRGDLAVIGRSAHHPQAERPDIVAALTDTFLSGWS